MSYCSSKMLILLHWGCFLLLNYTKPFFADKMFQSTTAKTKNKKHTKTNKHTHLPPGRGCRTISSQNTGIAWMGGRGSDPCLDFCEGFVHMHWGPSKVIIHHPKVIISPQKCPFFPQKPHLFNIFTLKNDLRTFVENCRESHLRDIMGQIAQDAWIRGWGGST